jgi:hypothetical protein
MKLRGCSLTLWLRKSWYNAYMNFRGGIYEMKTIYDIDCSGRNWLYTCGIMMTLNQWIEFVDFVFNMDIKFDVTHSLILVIQYNNATPRKEKMSSLISWCLVLYLEKLAFVSWFRVNKKFFSKKKRKRNKE